jgi:hypothetical protein
MLCSISTAASPSAAITAVICDCSTGTCFFCGARQEAKKHASLKGCALADLFPCETLTSSDREELGEQRPIGLLPFRAGDVLKGVHLDLGWVVPRQDLSKQEAIGKVPA